MPPTTQAAVDKLGMVETHADGTSKSIATLQNRLLQAGSFSGAATGLRFTNGSTLPAWAVTSQAGYDRDVPAKAIKNGLEIIREYTDSHGKALGRITLGDEIDVHVKIRATGDKGMGNIAIVDLLPGGFDPVIAAPPRRRTRAAKTQAHEAPAVRLPRLDLRRPIYADMREDRVVIYGFARPGVAGISSIASRPAAPASSPPPPPMASRCMTGVCRRARRAATC